MNIADNLLDYEAVDFCGYWVEFYGVKIKVALGPFPAGERFDVVKLFLDRGVLRLYRFLREVDGSVCGELASPDVPVTLHIEVATPPKDDELHRFAAGIAEILKSFLDATQPGQSAG